MEARAFPTDSARFRCAMSFVEIIVLSKQCCCVRKVSDKSIDILMGMPGVKLNAKARPVQGHSRETNSVNMNARFAKQKCEPDGRILVSDENWDDWRVRRNQRIGQIRHPCDEVTLIFPQAGTTFRFVNDHVHCFTEGDRLVRR